MADKATGATKCHGCDTEIDADDGFTSLSVFQERRTGRHAEHFYWCRHCWKPIEEKIPW